MFTTPVPKLKSLDYDDYWAERDVPDVPPRFNIIASLVAPDSRVADIGCGDGSLLRHLRDTRGATGWGVDISSRAIGIARERGLECNVADVTDSAFRLDEQSDVVIISEVLEHIPDPESLLVRLREQGVKRLIITVPNTGYVEHRLRLLFGRFPVQWLLHPGEHLRFWTVADFKATADVVGFRVRSIQAAHGWFPLARLWPSMFGSQVVYELTAPGDG